MKINTISDIDDPEIVKIIELIKGGMDSLLEAGELIAKKIKNDDSVIDKICKACPMLTPEILIRFEQVGLRKLHPNLLVFDGPGPDRLARLPYSVQEKYATAPVPLLIHTEKGWEVLPTDVRNLAVEQARQVFSSDGVRSEAAQRAYIEARATKNLVPPSKTNLPYRPVGKSLVIMKPCEITAKELAQILADMS